MTEYEVASPHPPHRQYTVRGRRFGNCYGVHWCRMASGWSIDHLPTGARVAVTPFPKLAVAAARLLARRADGVTTSDHVAAGRELKSLGRIIVGFTRSCGSRRGAWYAARALRELMRGEEQP